ncbi:hypothetical protein BJ875DRAFT_443454 [Amylocarpus encephaloides]|uniref:Uncharacterized protein n=1 Tax=Amylocarpus encephaloides TaxID=45428 RepID=A0A9P7YE86_9HELO|nr:hypothetical protein BJ875DRAFT_443454 [Amylocarpus encephaloides]
MSARRLAQRTLLLPLKVTKLAQANNLSTPETELADWSTLLAGLNHYSKEILVIPDYYPVASIRERTSTDRLDLSRRMMEDGRGRLQSRSKTKKERTKVVKREIAEKQPSRKKPMVLSLDTCSGVQFMTRDGRCNVGVRGLHLMDSVHPELAPQPAFFQWSSSSVILRGERRISTNLDGVGARLASHIKGLV